MEFISEELSKYVENHSAVEPELLKKLNRSTWENVMLPRMLSGHLQGRVLSMLSKIQQPKTILEIGTYTGYSALCLAEGLASDGQLYSIDVNEELEQMVKEYWSQSPFASQMHFKLGNAMRIIPELNQKWDLVFIDADKENYANYFDLVIDSVNPGGLIIADNVLWSGKILIEKELEKDKETKSIDAYNKKVNQDSRVESVLFPIRDGLMICRKK